MSPVFLGFRVDNKVSQVVRDKSYLNAWNDEVRCGHFYLPLFHNLIISTLKVLRAEEKGSQSRSAITCLFGWSLSVHVISPSFNNKKKKKSKKVVAAEIAVRLEYLQEAEQNSQHYDDVQKNILKGEISSLNVIFRHETLVNIHFSVTQCDTNYLLRLSALSFVCLGM